MARVIQKHISIFIIEWKTFHITTYLKKTTQILHWNKVIFSFLKENPFPVKKKTDGLEDPNNVMKGIYNLMKKT